MIRKLLTGVLLASLAITALAPATVSANNGKSTIYDRVAGINARTGEFGTLLVAVGCVPAAGTIVELLDDKSQKLTLFAPTNKAFGKSIPASILTACANDTADAATRALVQDVLFDHVVVGDRVSKWELRRKARKDQPLITAGGPVEVSGSFWRPKLGTTNPFNEDGVRDKARICATRGAGNGVIQIVDRVIIGS